MASVIQWNIGGLRSNYNELLLLMQSFQPVAFCLQELNIPNFYQFCNIQYSLVSKLPDVDNSITTTGGSGILIRKVIPRRERKLEPPLQACRISIPEPISVCSVDLPPSNTWSCNDLLSLISELPPPVLLMGNFNSHSTLGGYSSTNQKGLDMDKLLMQSNLPAQQQIGHVSSPWNWNAEFIGLGLLRSDALFERHLVSI
jgi:hypothetical protein